LELNDYRLLFLENDKNGYEKLKWTDHGLLFMKVLSDSTGQKQGREIHVVRNIGNRQQVCCFAAEAWADFPANMKISEYYTPPMVCRWEKVVFRYRSGTVSRGIPGGSYSRCDSALERSGNSVASEKPLLPES